MPRGIVQVVLLLFVGAVLGAVVLDSSASGREAIRESFVLLSLPVFALAVLELFGREGPPTGRERGWRWAPPVGARLDQGPVAQEVERLCRGPSVARNQGAGRLGDEGSLLEALHQALDHLEARREIDVQRINIVDGDGTAKMVLSNASSRVP